MERQELFQSSVVIALIAAELRMPAWRTGAVGASTLIGIFIGSPLAGWLTDRYRRRRTAGHARRLAVR
jgi:putative MFS transporter